MGVPKDKVQYVRRLAQAVSPDLQASLRENLKGEGYFQGIMDAYRVNPFLRLTDEEVRHFRDHVQQPGVAEIIDSRTIASRSTSPKFAVFCMPKSGSSFVESALRHALGAPIASLTSFGTPHSSSYFGMNSREQEIDELALIKAIITNVESFVAQHHTRCSAYLAFQMKFFGIVPVLTVRNILDCIVSFDDMMLATRADGDVQAWAADPQFSLPLNYKNLEAGTRYDLLSRSLGIWLVGFFLSWKRCERAGLIAPIRLQYEADILDKDRFVEIISREIPLSEDQLGRLRDYAREPDKTKSRFNVGVSGRGRRMIPGHITQFLLEYAANFRDEITKEELDYLIH